MSLQFIIFIYLFFLTPEHRKKLLESLCMARTLVHLEARSRPAWAAELSPSSAEGGKAPRAASATSPRQFAAKHSQRLLGSADRRRRRRSDVLIVRLKSPQGGVDARGGRADTLVSERLRAGGDWTLQISRKQHI